MARSRRKHRVLLVASKTGYQTHAFDTAAAHLGIDLALATDRCHLLDDPWKDRAIPVRFDKLDNAADEMADPAAEMFDGIIAVGDRPAQLAARIARRFQLRFHRPEAADAACNKFIARSRFSAAGLPVPGFFRVRTGSAPELAAVRRADAYPCVLKPVGLSGSRGVIRANNRDEFVAAFRRIESLISEPEVKRLQSAAAAERFIQIEDYIPGREFAVEGLMRGGRLQVLAIFDKPDPLEGPFFEETIYVTPSRLLPLKSQRELADAAQRAATALGLTDGAVHAELRFNDSGFWPLEVAPRPIGGLCGRVLRFEPELTLEALLLKQAVAQRTEAVELASPAAGVMMIPLGAKGGGVYQGVEGVESARAVPLVEGVEITAKVGQEFRPLPEGGSSYPGFIFANGPDPARVEEALRTALARLRFQFSTALPIARRPSSL